MLIRGACSRASCRRLGRGRKKRAAEIKSEIDSLFRSQRNRCGRRSTTPGGEAKYGSR